MQPKVELFRHNEEIERPEGVRTQWLSVTPEYATRALDAYEKFCDEHPEERLNRPVHQSQVNKYAADMKAGRWGRNHQGLAFDRNGILMDGQHRLWAVAESGVTVMMPVTYGLDREAQLTIDSGLKRTTADMAAIAGFQGISNLHVGVVKAIARSTSTSPVKLTTLQELQLLRDHQKALEFVFELFPRTRMAGITRAPVLAVVARAFYTQPPEKLKRFAEVLVSGLTQAEEEHVIIKLRNWLLTDRHGSGSNAAMETYGKTMRALHAYLRGEKISILYAAREELFPLPGLRRGPK
jgi:hypothetical protein